MAALQCDICGGKLIGRPGGLFECDSCGMQYDTAWAKDKIQQIQGTVKVEGTVAVTGKVQVEGPVEVKDSMSLDNFLKRGDMAVRDRKWDDAKIFYNQALNINAECARAYLGLALCQYRVEGRHKLPTRAAGFSSDFKRALQFSTGSLREDLEKIATAYEKEEADRQRRYQEAEQAKIDAQHRKDEEERRRLEKRRALEAQAAKQPKDLRAAIQKASKLQRLISVSKSTTAGLRADGTVIAAGRDQDILRTLGYCRDIVQICATVDFVYGLVDNGNVVMAGPLEDLYGRRVANHWRGVTAISAASNHVVGLLSNGTVVASVCPYPNSNYGQSAVQSWRDIVAVSAGRTHTVGLRADGTVVATTCTKKENEHGQSDVSGWTNIVAVAAGVGYTLGLRADGLVMATGKNNRNQCNVQDWSDIVAIAASDFQSFGLRADGTVVATNSGQQTSTKDVENWKDIVAIAAWDSEVIGLRRDGTLLTAGYSDWNTEVRQWKLFQSVDTINKERIASLKSQMLLQKGFGAGKRRKALEERIRQLEQEE